MGSQNVKISSQKHMAGNSRYSSHASNCNRTRTPGEIECYRHEPIQGHQGLRGSLRASLVVARQPSREGSCFVEFHLLKGPEADDHTLYASHTVWQSRAA